jgi:hypothetical protein
MNLASRLFVLVDLLVFTDGLTDATSGKNPESDVCGALASNPGRTMSNLKSLIDPKLSPYYR